MGTESSVQIDGNHISYNLLLSHFIVAILGVPSDTCRVMDSYDQEKPCIFPWSFKDHHNMDGCLNPSNHPGGSWCPTEIVNGAYVSGSGNYGLCKSFACKKKIEEN